MKRVKQILFFSIVLLLFSSQVNAQDTIAKVLTLENVDILPSIRETGVNPGLSIEKADSIQQSRFAAGTLTDLLGQNGMVYLKSYGGGSLAVTSLRGASANQTPVLWNGINLQSPTNGTVDLSLMPSILCDNISIQNGGGSAGWGSGAIGGVIQTGNVGAFNKGLTLKYVGQAGSFGEQNHGIKIGFSNSKMYADVRGYRQIAGNNFTYANTSSYIKPPPIDTMKNSWFFQQGIMGQIGYTTKSGKHFFSIRYWYQNSDRGIPPSMSGTNFDQRQKDNFFRTVGSWKMYFKKVDVEIKSAVLTEYMDYYQGYNLPNSYTNSISMVNEADCRIRFSKKYSGTFGMNNTWSKADVTEFVPITTQNCASVFASVQMIPNEKWNLVFNLRDEEVDGKITPIVGSFGAEYYHKKYLTLKTSLSKNYRIPTFNELYWVPGGNPNLKPEESWNGDITGVLHTTIKGVLINYSLTAYYRMTKNWIQWQPVGNTQIWSPENLLEVWSRGFEHRLKMDWKIKKLELTLLGAYDFVRATTIFSVDSLDPSIDKQLIYVPTNHLFVTGQISYMKFYLSYTHQYTDIRFTSSDHSTDLPEFWIEGVTIGKRIDYKNSYGDLFFRVNNLLNEDYQAVQNRPMPGRSYQIGVTIDFDK